MPMRLFTQSTWYAHAGQRRRFRRARPVVEVEIHEIEVPLQLTERLENPRIVEPVHFHRELRNRREQFVWRCEKRFPFSAFDVHLDDHTPAGIAVFANLVFQRVEEARIPVARRDFRRIRCERQICRRRRLASLDRNNRIRARERDIGATPRMPSRRLGQHRTSILYRAVQSDSRTSGNRHHWRCQSA